MPSRHQYASIPVYLRFRLDDAELRYFHRPLSIRPEDRRRRQDCSVLFLSTGRLSSNKDRPSSSHPDLPLGRLRLDKHYGDAILDDGTVVIFYSATLRLGLLALHYASLATIRPCGTRELRQWLRAAPMTHG